MNAVAVKDFSLDSGCIRRVDQSFLRKTKYKSFLKTIDKVEPHIKWAHDLSEFKTEFIEDKTNIYKLIQIKQAKTIQINDKLSFKLQTSLIPYLELAIIESKYILELKDDWDENGSIGYTSKNWTSAIQFTIDFYSWVSNFYSGKLLIPKIYHGPDGSFDIICRENDFRIFLNIDPLKNTGSFYSDRAKSQITEGNIPSLKDVDFQLITPPIQL